MSPQLHSHTQVTSSTWELLEVSIQTTAPKKTEPKGCTPPLSVPVLVLGLLPCSLGGSGMPT